MMRRMSPKTAARLRKAKTALAIKLAANPGVVAIGIGYRQRQGRIVQRGCLRVHVRAKLPLEAVPRRLRIPSVFRGVPVDVVESTFSSSAGNPAARHDPLIGGVVVSGARVHTATGEVGTAGCVIDGLLLSCWHVLYGPPGRNGDNVSQPTPLAGVNTIGANLAGVISNRVDCAVAQLNGSRGERPEILDLPNATLIPPPAVVGPLVRKSGATGVGLGVILSTDLDPPVLIAGQLRHFVDQIEIVPRPNLAAKFKTGKTDSGALWISDDDDGVVGLHFAGSPGIALVNPIDAVVVALADAGVFIGL